MERVQGILISLGLIAFILLLFFLVTAFISNFTGYAVSSGSDDLKECLKENDIVLYINSEIPSNTLAKIKLVDSLENFKIVNCLRNSEICTDEGISSFPTWSINNVKIEGDIDKNKIEELTSCKV